MCKNRTFTVVLLEEDKVQAKKTVSCIGTAEGLKLAWELSSLFDNKRRKAEINDEKQALTIDVRHKLTCN